MPDRTSTRDVAASQLQVLSGEEGFAWDREWLHPDTGLAVSERIGDGDEVLVLLHCVGLDSNLWRPVVAELSSGARVLSVDLPGHGRSRPATPSEGLPEVADAVAALISAEASSPVVIGGISMGGMVAQQVAVRHPELVKAVVIGDATYYQPAGRRSAFEARARRIEAEGVAPSIDETLDRWFSPDFRHRRPDVIKKVVETLIQTPPEAHVWAWRAIADLDLRQDLPRLRQPAIVLCGALDMATPPSTSRTMTGLIPGASYVEIPEAGHISALEQPGPWIRAYESLISSEPAREGSEGDQRQTAFEVDGNRDQRRSSVARLFSLRRHRVEGGQETNVEEPRRRSTGAEVRIDGASIEYRSGDHPDGFTAVDNVSVAVERSEFVSIVGPSGCGKTSLLMAIAGVNPISAGSIQVDGTTVTGPGLDRAVVFQEAGLLPWRTVEHNVALGLETQGLPKNERREIVKRHLELVGLTNFGRSYPHQLSGGMRQRVGLARAMAVDPGVLLMDEPFAALDAQTRERMADELLRVWEERRKTVVFITHSIEEAVYLSDRVLIMTFRPGKILADVQIDLPRPRNEAVRSGPEFSAIRHQIWTDLSGEVRRAEEAAFEAAE